MAGADLIKGLLADLQTITDVSRAGVISRSQRRLEPGEIRPAAVLFLDMVGFTPLTRQIGSEQVALLVDRTFRIFELTVQSHGGYQTGFGGDSANYIFAGHPNYPPVCEAALRAALKLKERIRQINESLSELGLSLTFRIGVSFGEVALKAVGSAEAQLTIMGEAINLAQRLESISRPGAVTTTQAVLEKAGDVFVSTVLGERELKGVGTFMTYEVTGTSERPVELRGAFRQLTPMVGRAELLKQAAERIEAWLAVRHDRRYLDLAVTDKPLTGHNKLLLLTGVSAVGKSRLAYELVRELQVRRPLVSTTVHFTEHASLRGFTAELAQIAGLDAHNLLERWNELIDIASTAVSTEYAERQRRHLPLLAHVLGCERLDTTEIGRMEAGSFETSCRLAARACCELAAHFSGAPVLLIFEDLQWLGDLAEAATDLLAHGCLPWPLIALGTARPEYEHREGALGEGEACTLNLSPLTRPEGDALLQALLPGLDLPEPLRAELHDKAAGLPYYYEEIARMLARRRLAVAHGSGYELAQELEDLDVPEDVCALILGRLDQLTPELKDLAMRASVLGRGFSVNQLAALEAELGINGSHDLNSALEALVEHHILARESGGRFFFEHTLLRESAYGALLTRNRRLLHGAAARVLEAMFVPGSIDEMQLMANRVQHLYQAGQHDSAQECCGELLLLKARSGNFDSWDRWEQMAEECQGQRDEPDATAAVPCCSMLRARGVRLLRQGNYQAAGEKFEQSLAAARAAGNIAGIAGALCDLGIVSKQAGRIDEALSYYQQALATARGIGDDHMEAVILGNVGRINYLQGRTDQAVEHYERALAISRRCGDKYTESMQLVYLGVLQLEHGKRQQAVGYLQQALELGRKSNNRVLESHALTNLGVVFHSLGYSDYSHQLWLRAAAINREIGRREGEALNRFNLGELACENDEMEAALEHYTISLRLFREQGNSASTIQALAQTGKVLARLGRAPEAFQALTEATTMCNSLPSMAEKGITECCWVYLDVAKGDLEQARSRLENARGVAREVNAGAGSQLALELSQAANWISRLSLQD
jgi:adenylate cyclase